MTHKEKAMKIFYEKFNCSQAVLGAYAEDYGLTIDQAMKVAACFSGGVRKGEVCGAVSGAIMVIGLKYGDGSDYKATAYPTSLRSIEDFALTDCDALTRVNLPSGLTSIGRMFFKVVKS